MGLYFRRGQSHARWVPTIASLTGGPTSAELGAGVDITPAITALSGLETSLNRINTPVMNAREELQTSGPQTLGDATLTILDDDGVVASGSTARAAARTALAVNSNGYLVIAPSKLAPTTGDKVDVFPALVGAVNRDYSLDPQLARSVVQLAITGQPRQDTAIL
jgi:hypothetical protein